MSSNNFSYLINDEKIQLRPGCKIIPKGEIYEAHLFEKKITKFKEKSFNDEVKNLLAEKMNENMLNAGYKMTVFDKSEPYLPAKKLEK